jgi:hypothetical protein
LRLAQAECARAIGFDTVNSGELTAQREKALLYARGEMPDLVMELSGRSKVVDTAVADAIETALPDLMDIFTGGDDVVAFKPVNASDVEAAEQEQDYLRHVLFNRNGGWLTIYEAFKDALTCKTGVFSWRWDGEFEPQPDYHDRVGLPVLMRCMDEGVCDNVVPGEPDEDGLPTVSFEFTPRHTKGRVVVEAVAPEDLAVAADTRTLAWFASVRGPRTSSPWGTIPSWSRRCRRGANRTAPNTVRAIRPVRRKRGAAAGQMRCARSRSIAIISASTMRMSGASCCTSW